MKKFFAKLFNQKKNAGLVKQEQPINQSDDVEVRLAKWLAHPNEYGKRPYSTKIIKTGHLNFKVLPPAPPMKYQLIEYQMSENGPKEIGVADEVNVWSFLNSIDYEKANIDELAMAYKGKLFELLEAKFRLANKNSYEYSVAQEEEKIKKYFSTINPSEIYTITDIIKYFDGIIFFGFNLKNPENGEDLLIPTHYNENSNKHYGESYFGQDHPLLPIAMYMKIGSTLTEEVIV